MRWFGDTDIKKKVIRVNVKKSKKTKRKGEVLDSIAHETLHARHPKKSEQNIRTLTTKTITKLNKKQKSKLYQLTK